jgi:NAD(P)-dependent dehydrogenase (short-subunit alcohol dehydrogenase family)
MDEEAPVAIVTGASSGIGQWTALGLVRAGMHVVCVGRSRERLEATVNWIAREAGVPPPDIEIADFASLGAVRDLGMRLLRRYPRIHLLINNAGGAWVGREVTADGYEMTLAVNHLAPFLLTRILLPALRAAAPSRIVNLASTAHLRGRIDFADLMASRNYGALRAYAQSKLANVLFTVELARRLAGTGVTVNCVHPGVVATQFGAKGGWRGAVWRMVTPFLLTSEQGAQESLRAALAPELVTVSGAYFSKGRKAATNPVVQDDATAARLWRDSEALVDAALLEPALA